MNAALPKSVEHLFTVKKIGKCYAILCKQCSWLTNAMILPVTQATCAKLFRHCDYHGSFDYFVDRQKKAAASSDAPAK